MTGVPELVAAVRSAKQYLTYVSAGPFQYAVAEALSLPESYFTDFRADMLARRDLLAAGLSDAGFAVLRTAGTYFVTTDISGRTGTDSMSRSSMSRSSSSWISPQEQSCPPRAGFPGHPPPA